MTTITSRRKNYPAYAVLNPMEADCPFSFSGLSGAGVAFYLLMGLRMRLREQGEQPVPDLRLYLDLVCLGTVADLVPLIEENRVLVTHGLRQIATSQRPGIRALRAVSGDGRCDGELYRISSRTTHQCRRAAGRGAQGG